MVDSTASLVTLLKSKRSTREDSDARPQSMQRRVGSIRYRLLSTSFVSSLDFFGLPHLRAERNLVQRGSRCSPRHENLAFSASDVLRSPDYLWRGSRRKYSDVTEEPT